LALWAVIALLPPGATTVAAAAADGNAESSDVGASSAAASEASADVVGRLPEITVTAQRREQSIQDVGIAISAYSGDQLRELGFQDSYDIARLTPGLHISGNNGGEKTLFTVRGVTQNDFNDQTESPVAVYIDDEYVAFGQGQTFGMYDLDRVEVLKGPQGTLFGRNATGGLVQFITRKPSHELDGFADVTYGSHDQIRFEGAIGGAITDSVASRTSVYFDRFHPIIKNNYPYGAVTLDGVPSPLGHQDTFNDNTLALRQHLEFQPLSDLNVLLTGNYARTRQSTAPLMELPTIPVFDADGNHINTIVASPTDDRQAAAADGTAIHHPLSGIPGVLRPPGGNLWGPSCGAQQFKDLTCSMDFAYTNYSTTDTWGTSATVKWSTPIGVLTSVTDYKDFDKLQGLPASGGAPSTVNVLMAAHAQQFSQEVRFNGQAGGFRWVGGAYYLHVNLHSDVALKAQADSLFEPLVGLPFQDTALSHQTTRSISLFGQVEYDLPHDLTLIAGLRGIKERKEFTGEEDFFINTNPKIIDTGSLLFNVQPRNNHTEDDFLWSGKLQLDWHPTRDLLLYGGVNRGVKAGGFNATTTFGAGFPASEIPYGSEVLYAYEAGMKWDNLFSRTTRLNLSAYHYDYRNYQGFFFTQITGYVSNLDAKYNGGELEILTSPVEDLTFGASVAYLNATIYGVQLGPGEFVNTRPSFAPQEKYTALARKRWVLPQPLGSLSAQLDYNYVSSVYDNIRNFDASRLHPYGIADLRLEWRPEAGHWRVSAFVNNLTDRRYFTIGYDLSTISGSNSLAPGKPRWYGLTVHYEIGK